MERLEKFKIAFTLKHPSVYDDSILNELYINFDDKYIDELISKFDYKECEMKNIIKDNLVRSILLDKLCNITINNKSEFWKLYKKEMDWVTNTLYTDINNYINKGEND